MTQRQNFERGVELRFAEGGGLFLGERAEFAGALSNRCGGNMIGHRLGRGAGANGVREDVEIGERAALDKVESRGVIFGGFAGKTGDDVGADGGVGKLVADEFDTARVVFGAIPAMHRAKDAVGAGLQRHVEVLGDARRRSE